MWIHPLAHCIVKPIQLLIKTNRPTQWSCIIYLHQQHSFPKIFYSVSGSLCCKLLITVTINWNLNYPTEIISSNEPEKDQGTICTSCSTSTNRLASTKQQSFWFSFDLNSFHVFSIRATIEHLSFKINVCSVWQENYCLPKDNSRPRSMYGVT